MQAVKIYTDGKMLVYRYLTRDITREYNLKGYIKDLEGDELRKLHKFRMDMINMNET